MEKIFVLRRKKFGMIDSRSNRRKLVVERNNCDLAANRDNNCNFHPRRCLRMGSLITRERKKVSLNPVT